jgi:hypothetical protein
MKVFTNLMLVWALMLGSFSVMASDHEKDVTEFDLGVSLSLEDWKTTVEANAFGIYLKAGVDASNLRETIIEVANLSVDMANIVLNTAHDVLVFTGKAAREVYLAAKKAGTIAVEVTGDVLVLAGKNLKKFFKNVAEFVESIGEYVEGVVIAAGQFLEKLMDLAIEAIRNGAEFVMEIAADLSDLAVELADSAVTLIIDTANHALCIVRAQAKELLKLLSRTVEGAITLSKNVYNAAHDVVVVVVDVTIEAVKNTYRVVVNEVKFATKLAKEIAKKTINKMIKAGQLVWNGFKWVYNNTLGKVIPSIFVQVDLFNHHVISLEMFSHCAILDLRING